MNNSLQRTVILLFAKTPVSGSVKTRLTPILGDDKAAQLYSAMVEHCVMVASSNPSRDIQLWCTPQTEHPLFQRLRSTYPLSLHIQQGHDLGERMCNAFEQALQNYQTAVLMGTDCLSITPELLDQAFQALDKGFDAAIAPAEDGGYVLLGLRYVNAQVFSEIEWGTERAWRQTITRLRQASLTWQELDTQWDVDRPEDLDRLKRAVGYQWHKNLQQTIESLPNNFSV